MKFSLEKIEDEKLVYAWYKAPVGLPLKIVDIKYKDSRFKKGDIVIHVKNNGISYLFTDALCEEYALVNPIYDIFVQVVEDARLIISF